MQPEPFPPALRLGIDLDALKSNWQALDRLSGHARAGAAVKADGYGVGAGKVVPALHEAGCRDFFVAHWSEVADVARAVAPSSIAVLHGPRTAQEAAYALASGARPVINSLDQARRWIDAGGGTCHLMVDTGMNRLGIDLSELGAELLHRLEIDVLMSHLVAAEEDVPSNAAQRERWRQACGTIAHGRASLANSAGISLGAPYHGDLTRPGIALYGGVPRADMADTIRQVVTPQAAVLQVRQVAPGQTIGYNATYTAQRAMRVGTVGIGYADGYLRAWSNRGHLRAGELLLPVLGRISMDLTVVDLSEAPAVREGDWLSVEYSLPDAAKASGLSQYELLTSLGRRFAR